jgi:hypothetical protein
MQKRKTGKAYAGCVCLPLAPDEGILSRGTQPSRFGTAGLPVQYLAWRVSPPHAGDSFWNPAKRPPDADCTIFATFLPHDSSAALRSGELT